MFNRAIRILIVGASAVALHAAPAIAQAHEVQGDPSDDGRDLIAQWLSDHSELAVINDESTSPAMVKGHRTVSRRTPRAPAQP